MTWYVYMVRGSDESLYTGITTDLERRVKEHNSKQGAKSLRGKLPVTLVYFEKRTDQVDAAKREREIKGWLRIKKLDLIKGFIDRVHP